MTAITDLETPCVVVDIDRMERNIARMAQISRESGIDLRPHAKTHKIPEIARRQVAAGSRGITVAKLSEAEVFADAGIDDIFIAYPLWGESKWERLCRLAERANIRVAADSYEVLEGISSAASRRGLSISVRLEVESGFGRCGLQTDDDVLQLARRMSGLPGIRLVGIMGFEGQSYEQTQLDKVQAVAENEGARLVHVAGLLRDAGFDITEVSAGSTPTARFTAHVPGITEIRPGTYVFSDRHQVALASSGLDDCALAVMVTVVSRPTATRAIIDGGTKTFSSDTAGSVPGFGIVPGHPDLVAAWLSEEHGILEVRPDLDLPVGSRLEIVPNHACGTLNMHDQVYAVREGMLEDVWSVAARGCVR